MQIHSVKLVHDILQEPAPTSTATFDAVVVCNGHYSNPRRPALPGAGQFPGRILHSHSYRTNGPYAGLTVVVIGASASGEDISREIAVVADKVLFFLASYKPRCDCRSIKVWLVVLQLSVAKNQQWGNS